eukprot:TRINITY_DN5610_c0_g1_i1.p1 TRINITY_DN5610_c0_g1~~TRINITY_DN5610_c0_g1_i1.p1  ORF type:complete len:1290 (+),score=98.00 TRINITY_DN5610_c0_g1_i1:482-4351(+)
MQPLGAACLLALLSAPSVMAHDECTDASLKSVCDADGQLCADPDTSQSDDWECRCDEAGKYGTAGQAAAVCYPLLGRGLERGVDECVECARVAGELRQSTRLGSGSEPLRRPTGTGRQYKIPGLTPEECHVECLWTAGCMAFSWRKRQGSLMLDCYEGTTCCLLKVNLGTWIDSGDTRVSGVIENPAPCAGSTCLDAGQQCVDPTAGTTTFGDWVCRCSMDGRTNTTAAVVDCPLSGECGEATGAQLCGANEQLCFDPDPMVDGDWMCALSQRYDGAVVVLAVTVAGAAPQETDECATCAYTFQQDDGHWYNPADRTIAAPDDATCYALCAYDAKCMRWARKSSGLAADCLMYTRADDPSGAKVMDAGYVGQKRVPVGGVCASGACPAVTQRCVDEARPSIGDWLCECVDTPQVRVPMKPASCPPPSPTLGLGQLSSTVTTTAGPAGTPTTTSPDPATLSPLATTDTIPAPATPAPNGTATTAPAPTPQPTSAMQEHVDATVQVANTALGAAGAGLLGGAGGAASGVRLALMASACDPELVVPEERYHRFMSPLQLVMLESYAVGAVVGNTLVCAGGVALSYAVSLVIGAVGPRVLPGYFAGRDMLGEAAFPSVPLKVFCLVMQGTILAAGDLLLHPGDPAGFVVGFIGAVGCMWVLLYMFHVITYVVPRHAVVLKDPTTVHPIARFFLGEDEWLSRDRRYHIVKRWSSMLRPFRFHTRWYVAMDSLGAVVVALLHAPYPHTMFGCAYIKFFAGCVLWLLLALEVYLRPHRHVRNLVLDLSALFMQAVASHLHAYAYFSESPGNNAFAVGRDLFFYSAVVLLVRACIDLAVQVYVWFTKRTKRLMPPGTVLPPTSAGDAVPDAMLQKDESDASSTSGSDDTHDVSAFGPRLESSYYLPPPLATPGPVSQHLVPPQQRNGAPDADASLIAHGLRPPKHLPDAPSAILQGPGTPQPVLQASVRVSPLDNAILPAASLRRRLSPHRRGLQSSEAEARGALDGILPLYGMPGSPDAVSNSGSPENGSLAGPVGSVSLRGRLGQHRKGVRDASLDALSAGHTVVSPGSTALSPFGSPDAAPIGFGTGRCEARSDIRRTTLRHQSIIPGSVADLKAGRRTPERPRSPAHPLLPGMSLLGAGLIEPAESFVTSNGHGIHAGDAAGSSDDTADPAYTRGNPPGHTSRKMTLRHHTTTPAGVLLDPVAGVAPSPLDSFKAFQTAAPRDALLKPHQNNGATAPLTTLTNGATPPLTTLRSPSLKPLWTQSRTNSLAPLMVPASGDRALAMPAAEASTEL